MVEIDALKDENKKLREENRCLKEQYPLHNISNIVPSTSNKAIKTAAMMRPESSSQMKQYDDFQITEQFVLNPHMFSFFLKKKLIFIILINQKKKNCIIHSCKLA